MTAESIPDHGSDRSAVARLLAETAYDVFDSPPAVATSPIRLRYKAEILNAAAPGRLTAEQDEFVRTKLQQCPPKFVTSATHRVTWTDSEEISNVAFCGPLGPVVPIVARETTLAFWRMLRADERLAARVAAVSVEDQGRLDSTTTDRTPPEILRTGVDAAARVLVQHAYLAAHTPYDEPAEFAEALRDSGIFTTVAGTWHWGLQASTYRRGLVPVRMIAFGGRLSYSADTVAALRAMKEARIEAARTLAVHASSVGTAFGHAVDDAADADPSALQYGVLEPGEQPRCLAHAPQTVDGRRVSLVQQLADAFVGTFVRLLDVVQLELDDTRSAPSDADTGTAATTFEVPDMTCQHCIRTITRTVAAFGVDPPEFDLGTKRVVATFSSAAVRDQSFAAIRARGYTVVSPHQKTIRPS